MSNRIAKTREQHGSRMQRTMEIELREVKDAPDNYFRLIASTDANYDWGYYREQLLHGRENVDTSGAVSVLFNHDRNQIIGRIVSSELDGHRMIADVEIDADVSTPNGMKLLKALKNKYVRGVSIGYDYRTEDCTFTEDSNGKRGVIVNRWQLREISITPTPADLDAQVTRTRSEWASQAFKAKNTEVLPMEFSNWLKALGFDEKSLSADQLTKLRSKFDEEQKQRAAGHDDELAKERTARKKAEDELAAAKHVSDMATLARSHAVEWKDEDAKGKTREECVTLMLQRKAEAAKTQTAGSNVVNVTREASEKADAAAEDAIGILFGLDNKQDLGMRGGSMLDVGRRWLAARGDSNILAVGRRELAEMLLGSSSTRYTRYQRQSGRRDAANVTSGMFTSFLLANVMDKVIYNGFMASDEAITYPIWTAEREVMDFKQFTGAALDAGNLVETTENTAFPELAKAEGGYNAALGLWGATISLTLQAMQNDDLGEFMRWLRMAGFIARRTVDVKVYADLANATWTSRTTAGDLSDDTVSINRSNMAGIAGPAGQVLGLTPRYLIVPAGLRKQALGITQLAAALIMNDNIKVNTDLLPVITPFLATAATPSQSNWYMAASKMYEPLIVATLQGVKAPIIEEYDPGAVAARKWKIMFPFKVVIPTVASKVQGIWQGTH